MEIAHGAVEKITWDVTWATPGPAAGEGVYRYCGFRMDLAGPRRREGLPALIATLVIVFGGEDLIGARGGRDGAGRHRPVRMLLFGPRTRPHIGQHSGRLAGIEVVMAPWAAHALFGIPMHELTDRVVDLESSMIPTSTPSTPSPCDAGYGIGATAGFRADPHFSALAVRLAGAPDWRARFRTLDGFLAARRGAGTESTPQVVRAHDLLRRSGGSMSIASVAESVGWDPRRLQRAFPTHIGVSPKAAARILRLQRALRLLGSGLPLARVAYECSYFDQAHLTHDITQLTGRSPRRLLAERAAMPPGPRTALLPSRDPEF